MIQLKNISKHFGNQSVLENISLELPQNQIISLIGPNGSGKSTLLSIISRLLEKDSGSVSISQKDLFQYKNKELAKHLAILKQANNIELKLTVEDLVSFGRFPYSQGSLTDLDHKKINEAIDFCALQELRQKYINELSGGQRQRAFLAMVIAQDTDYILLDKPLNNLDMKLSVQIMKTLKRLVLEKNKTVVIVIHEINFAAGYSDYIIGMKNGQIFCEGKASEIIMSDNLNNLFDMDFEIIEHNGKRICNYFNL